MDNKTQSKIEISNIEICTKHLSKNELELLNELKETVESFKGIKFENIDKSTKTVLHKICNTYNYALRQTIYKTKPYYWIRKDSNNEWTLEINFHGDLKELNSSFNSMRSSDPEAWENEIIEKIEVFKMLIEFANKIKEEVEKYSS